ncbi:MAG TPA: glycerophosphodiester phosphodiesterase [Thermodesulfovibrionales bacterium]|nr:glycerophosphodiester phosphodiesterase [Thermodesulfovibrionales bacterium]
MEDILFLRVGHRGARAYETENTLESFQRAIASDVNAIEMDVRESKDRKLVVIHDDNLKKVFGKDMKINEATLKELKDATGDRIPTLQEALKIVDGNVDKILVELKEPGYERPVLEVIRKERLRDRAIIVSFHEEALSTVRKLDKTIETGLIYAKLKNPIDAALRLDAQYLIPLYRFTHTRNIEDAHRHNLKVIVWTINTRREAKEYQAKGVDGIASDKPDIF